MAKLATDARKPIFFSCEEFYLSKKKMEKNRQSDCFVPVMPINVLFAFPQMPTVKVGRKQLPNLSFFQNTKDIHISTLFFPTTFRGGKADILNLISSHSPLHSIHFAAGKPVSLTK